MALHEPHEKRTPQQWYTRLARERLDLSASVEETLADTSSQEDQWPDEGEYTSSVHTSRKMTLIPPRFSLQSRMLPAVQTGIQDVQPSTHAHSPTRVEVSGEQKTAPVANPPNILTRLAQRLTSSLAAFGASVQPLAPPVIASSPVEESQELSRKQEGRTVASGEAVSASNHTHAYAMPFIDALPSAHPTAEGVPPIRSKQRLAGHTGKIRLQTASLPAVTPQARSVDIPIPPDSPAAPFTHERAEVREPVEVWVRLATSETEKKATTVSISGVDTGQSEVGATSKEQRAENALLAAPGIAGRGMLSGSDVFESGQSDLMVHNAHITESSVVVVMLTSNPGPVVVQYVSLHPYEGFTIHLTAPVTMKTSFNYVVLLGELF
jgi:hypothetical protein